MKNGIRSAIVHAVILIGLCVPASAANPLLKEFEDAFVSLSALVRPSVVEISARGAAPPVQENRGRLDDLFRFFRSPDGDKEEEEKEDTPQPPRISPRRPASTGSGFIFDARGHIITNNHVVAEAAELTVELWDGTKREATVVGTDPSADIAVIKVDPTGLDLRPVELGSSTDLRVGQFAIAIGSPRGQTGSLSFGHISGLGREHLNLPDPRLRFQNFIQTDAAINLGNSGGPLVNIDGDVIGVNVAIAYGANSIGFAIPIDRVKEIVPQLIAKGKVVRGWLGVGIRDVETAAMIVNQEVADYVEAYNLPDDEGALVISVTWDGPAEHSTLEIDDVVRSINSKKIRDTTDLINIVSDFEPGTRVNLGVWREGRAKSVSVVVGEFPGRPTALYGRAFLGMHVMEPEAREGGDPNDFPSKVVVPVTEPGSPADKAGIRPGHFILEVAQRKVTGRDSFRDLLRAHAKPGKTLLVLVRLGRPGEEPEAKFIQVPDDFDLD